MGAAATKSGRFGTTGRAVPGERDGKVYARNRCCEASSSSTSSNPVDLGWCAVRTRPSWWLPARWPTGAGNCRDGCMCRAWQVVVKVYGVAMNETAGAKPGASPVDRATVNVGTARSPFPALVAGIGPMPTKGCGWGGAVVVLRGRESRSHGEGRQREEARRDCDVRRRVGEHRRRDLARA